MRRIITITLFLLPLLVYCGEWPREMRAYLGIAPKLDGIISEGEYDDATAFSGTKFWMHQFAIPRDSLDFSFKGWVKHDGNNLYFAFDVIDDTLYGYDTEKWGPIKNPKVHELSPDGFPWWGDGLEILMNPAYKWNADSSHGAVGDGSSWQMVVSTHKSRLGGLGVPGLMEGEPRVEPYAWNIYQKWILNGDMQAAVRIKSKEELRGYVVEWKIKGNPCLEIKPGKYWSAELGEVKVGLNIGTQDLDNNVISETELNHMNHEDWWTGDREKRTRLEQFGTLILMPGTANK